MKTSILTAVFVSSLFLVATAVHATDTKSAAKAEAPKEVSKSTEAKKVVKKAPASDPFDEPIVMPTHFKKGWKIEVFSYDADADVIEAGLASERDAGPFYFTPEEFSKGTGIPSNLTGQQKKDLVGSEYTLSEDIKFLTLDEYENRGR